MTTSPFTLNRFEYEQRHLYYLPEPFFSVLQGVKPVFLIGSRGTGKTTLLQALNWQEQIANQALQPKLLGTFLSRRCLGIYLRIPLYPASALDTWHIDDDAVRGAAFATYLDLVWIEAALEAVAQLLAIRVIRSTAARENALIGHLLENRPELLREEDRDNLPRGLKPAARLFHQRRRELEKLAIARAPLTPLKLTELFPIGQIGELGRDAANQITRFLSECETDGSPWQVKVCLDEAECLSAFQQKVINTAVRLASASLSYVISYVRPMEEMTATLLPNISLQRADREILELDAMDDPAFLDLVEGVSKVRIGYCLADFKGKFTVTQILGELDINALIYAILQTSEDPGAGRLLESGRELQALYAKCDAREDLEPETTLPLYQAYLIDRLKLRPPSPETPKTRRAQDSAELRKRMVAAYLNICAELDQKVRYAFADMLLQMCDKCIRDYLSQMDEVFQASNVQLPAFLDRVVPIEQQDAALRRASDKKREYVPNSGVGSPTEALRLIDALGELTARLQKTKHQQRGLRSSERGIFVVDLSLASEESQKSIQVIIDAADAGFFKLLKREPHELQFRVHCSLAAAYGFSYRGAYYPVELRTADIVGLCTEADSDRRAELLRRLEVLAGE